MKRICLWATPRNVSTALMYSFAQRSDMTVVDEPLYGYYLKASGAQHPGREDVLQNMECDGEKVIANMLSDEYPAPAVFFKQMTHHLQSLKLDFLEKTANILLIRNPAEIVNSYTKVHSTPTWEEVGIGPQFEFYNYLLKQGKKPLVLDSKYLLQNPRGVLSKVCEYLEIPFEEKMLSWPAGPRPEDGVWAKYWYKNLHQSTGFQPYKKREIDISPPMEKLVWECMPAYDFLHDKAVK